nr:MAG TPA: Cell wall hydrolase autolysin [Caudoviricetes sp.]
MKILLIAGHGGTDPGTKAHGRRECDLTREIVPKIKSALEQYECEVEMYNPARSAIHDIIVMGYPYNFRKFDYVLEVHFNAFRLDRGDGVTMGTEIYVTRGEKITTVEQAVVKRISALGLKNRGVKRTDFDVIKYAKSQGVSSALLEVCFMDDADDMKIYTAKKQQIAQAVADGIAEGYQLKKKEESTMAGFKDTTGHWAQAQIEQLAKLGILGGYPDGTFKPDAPITRAEVAAVVSRLYEKLK